ncbi:MAG: ABC transporter substrate-binding protein [Planctomycetes bacterium]|nr:ABC transporter substrate-binding protein [Planctomycetota bacterium]
MFAENATRSARRFRLAGLAVVALLAAGCGDPAAQPGPAAPVPSRGGEFSIGMGGIETLDPARVNNLNESFPVQQLFDGLVQFGDDLAIQPCLARSWNLSEDRRTFTFALVENARFHDGRVVEAEDVVHSFERLLDPKTGSPAADFLSIIEGAKSFQSGRSAHVAGLRAASPHQFEVTLTEPYQPFLGLLAIQYTKIVPRDADTTPDFGRHPIGSGAYRFESWSKEGGLTLTANDSYFQGRPYLDRIRLRDLPRDDEVRRFRDGELDYLAASPTEFDELLRERRFALTKRPLITLTYLGFNLRRPPFDDVRLRRAIEFGLDRGAIANALDGREIPAGTILPPGMPGYDPSAAIYRHDLARARELMAAAGFPDGRGLSEFRLVAGRLPGHEALLDEMTRQFAQLGIRLHVDSTDDFDDYLNQLKTADLFILGWSADFPDPDNFFEPIFRSGARCNFGHYENASLDALIDDARHKSDKLDRLKDYRYMERRLLEDAVVAPLFHDASRHCFKPSVKGLVVGPLGMCFVPMKRVYKIEQ